MTSKRIPTGPNDSVLISPEATVKVKLLFDDVALADIVTVPSVLSNDMTVVPEGIPFPVIGFPTTIPLKFVTFEIVGLPEDLEPLAENTP
jgi:hypothetical protein